MAKFTVIKTLAEMENLRSSLINTEEFVAVDTETTGVDKGATVIGFSVATSIDEGFYVILHAWNVATQTLDALETVQGAKSFMETLVGLKLVLQNAVFDCSMIKENFGVELIDSVHTDTLLLGHLLNENRPNGLKQRAVELYGESEAEEQRLMKESVTNNGGVLTKTLYELYKADADLIARYGAQDAVLTLKIFFNDVPQLYEEGLDKFFYEEETMPLCRLVTYELNTTGLRVDNDKLQALKLELQTQMLELKGFIYKEIGPIIKDKYPGNSKANTFNIGASQQLAWLLFSKMGLEFGRLTDGGKDMCLSLGMKVPYDPRAKREFTRQVSAMKDQIYQPLAIDPKTKKPKKPAKVKDPWVYMSTDEENLSKHKARYTWISKLLEHAGAKKLLSTYVEGIESRVNYGVVRPNFLQHGTTSGRYSCKNPNFQNLPRDDKRVKGCVVSRPGKVFVGADHSQLEPRVFTSVSQDKRLLKCFSDGEDFYSVVGAPIFHKTDVSMFKKDENSFANKYPKLRNIAKAFALATPYGTSAFQQASKLGLPADECQAIIDDYFATYPAVEAMMLESHEQAKTHGVVYSLFGRPRRMPDAMQIRKLYGKNTAHRDLPYAARNLCNLAMNHKVQSSAASIMNRNLIALALAKKEKAKVDPRWNEVRIAIQVHDEGVLEAPEALAEEAAALLKHCMENSVSLPGVALIAEPKAAYDLAGLK